MGADQLPDRQCGHFAGEQLVFAAVWAEALPDYVRGAVYGVFVLLRSGAVAGLSAAGAGDAGSGGRGAAAAVAGDSDGELSAEEARGGDGAVRLWGGGGSGSGANAGRLADGLLHVAVRVLHQHSGGDSGGLYDQPVRARSAVYQQEKRGGVRQPGIWAAVPVVGVPADHSGQGPGGGLVQRGVAAVGDADAGGVAGVVCAA